MLQMREDGKLFKERSVFIRCESSSEVVDLQQLRDCKDFTFRYLYFLITIGSGKKGLINTLKVAGSTFAEFNVRM